MAPQAKKLGGSKLAKKIEAALAAEISGATAGGARKPGLAVLMVGNDPASAIYVGRKEKACARVGIASRKIELPGAAGQDEVLAVVRELNDDDEIDGILVQLPLPGHIDSKKVLRAIVPSKDVDAFHPQTLGHALIGDARMAPCTPQGIMLLLAEANVELRGAEVVIINHSNIVGKPLAALLINQDATVTVCHHHTRDVQMHTQRADVVVTGTGGKRRLAAADLKPGAVVIDVSMNRDAAGNLCGDALPDVWDVASWVTPVPGGVGPMTIAVLLQNTVRAYAPRMQKQ